MRSFFLFFLISSFFNFAEASSQEIQKSCRELYHKQLSLKKAEKVCFCIQRNIDDHLTAEQQLELLQIYTKRRGRFEASKSERLKALLEFDSEVHRGCLKNQLWIRPKEDLGRPDPIE